MARTGHNDGPTKAPHKGYASHWVKRPAPKPFPEDPYGYAPLTVIHEILKEAGLE